MALQAMQPFLQSTARFIAVCLLLGATILFPPQPVAAGGVTIITHGLNGNADGWVYGMANQIPNYYRFPGAGYTFYKLYFIPVSGGYNLTWARLGGGAPATTSSGEIIVAFDWSQLADGNSFNTYQIAGVLAQTLTDTAFIPELNGHALCELPVHLIGHSRGGSLMCETSRIIGTNGVWIDHLTTLDPHPLNNDIFSEWPLFKAVDASATNTYVNVLYRDNYWQQNDSLIDPNGEPVNGAYNRYLHNCSGGYENMSSSTPHHSNVHLWYHGSINYYTPVSDTEAFITTAERASWWTNYEDYGSYPGFFSGFYYSLIGGGNRMSPDQPVGFGYPAIKDGYNQYWDLGAGAINNRTVLSANNGAWPSVIKFNRLETNRVVQGQSTPLKVYWQWEQPVPSNALLRVYLDNDYNPLNANSVLLKQFTVPGGIYSITTNITLSVSNASLGFHAFYATISANGRTRYLYAPELVEVVSNPPPRLDIEKISANQFLIGINGLPNQQIILQYSSNLQSWVSGYTNTLSTSRLVVTNTTSPSTTKLFHRALLVQ